MGKKKKKIQSKFRKEVRHFVVLGLSENAESLKRAGYCEVSSSFCSCVDWQVLVRVKIW